MKEVKSTKITLQKIPLIEIEKEFNALTCECWYSQKRIDQITSIASRTSLFLIGQNWNHIAITKKDFKKSKTFELEKSF